MLLSVKAEHKIHGLYILTMHLESKEVEPIGGALYHATPAVVTGVVMGLDAVADDPAGLHALAVKYSAECYPYSKDDVKLALFR